MPEFEKRTQFGGRHHARDPLGDRAFALGGEGEDSADLDAGAGGRVHAGIRVAEDAGAVSQPVVDVFIAIDVASGGRPWPTSRRWSCPRPSSGNWKRRRAGGGVMAFWNWAFDFARLRVMWLPSCAGPLGSIGMAHFPPNGAPPSMTSEYVFIHLIGRAKPGKMVPPCASGNHLTC